MFRKTRNRIMLLNMAMVSAVVIIAFAVIFMTAYTREQVSNRDKLYSHAIPYVSVAGGPFRTETTIHMEPVPAGFSVSGFAQRIVPGAGLSFSLLADSDGNLVDVNSMVDLSEGLYNQAAFEAMKSGRQQATLSLAGRTWQYIVTPMAIEFWETNDIAFVVSGVYNDIRFLDVTDSHRMLWSLGLTLAGLTVVILAVFFFISRFFANRAVQPMEEAFEKQSRFIADASHELKTPLSIINADCGVLYANKEETMESQLKWVDSITRAADRITGLVGDMLSLARMEEKESKLDFTEFDLSLTVVGAVSDMEQAALDKGLIINRSMEPDINIHSDREQIHRILAVLLDNAIKYTQPGGKVSVSLTQEKRHVACCVRNSGAGIPPEDLPRLFDRFYRGDPARTSENGGFGLGLAIAKSAADRLGAKLMASSEPGQYTEFTLILNSLKSAK